MCKYCALEPVYLGLEDKTNKIKPILKIKDGSQIFDMYLIRHVYEPDNINTNVLEINLSTIIGNAEYNVKSKEIKIKYCPFCGEAL